MMRIKAAEMERMFGMSPNGIRLYEKHGIIKPQRNGSAGYRVYGAHEIQAMGFGVQYRRYGFSMNEAAELLSGIDENQQIAAMQRRADIMEVEIERMMLARKSLKVNVQRAKRALELDSSCDTEVKPAMYFLATQRGEQFLDKEMHELAGAWVERYAPHLSPATVLDGNYISKEECDRPPLIGIAVDAEAALELGLLPSEYLTYMPPKRCVVTGIEMIDGEFDLPLVIKRVRMYAQENQIQLHIGGIIRWIQCIRRGKSLAARGLLWVPLHEEEARTGVMK